MSDTSRPSVSVVTPSYNQAAFIEDTIQSVKRQTYDDLTHIVVDGDSDDGTVDILKSYPDLKWISEPDEGQADAVNKGVEMADSDIVGWVNSDDPYVYRDVIESVVKVFERDEVDIVFGHSLLIDGENRVLRVLHVPEFDIEKLRRHCYLLQPSVFFRREVLAENPLDTSFNYSLDYELWLRLADYEWTRLDKILAADRNYGERKTHAGSDESRLETIELRKEHGVYQESGFAMKQLFDKVDWRVQRVWGLPALYDVLNSPDSAFAIDIQKPPLARALRTQLYQRKQKLA